MLLLAFLGTLIAVEAICPSGYVDDGNGNCISSPLKGTRIAAYARCSEEGASLFEITSGFVNHRVQEYGSGVEMVWLGLTCSSSSLSSCQWDSGKNLTSGSYSNFYLNHPKVDLGACVVMIVPTGSWYSVDCYQTIATYGCESTPGVPAPRCAVGSSYFRGHCYWGITANSFSSASATCASQCGTVASIHSEGENSFVRDIGLTVSSDAAYLYTGLTYAGERYVWEDDSPYDYNHFSYQNPALGSCVSMARIADVVPQGAWISSQCSGNLVTVCEKNLTNPCDSPVTEAPPLAPFQCEGASFYTGAGQMYSPGFPYGSQPNHCDYLITEDETLHPSISFQQLALDSSSSISFYSSLFDKTPFVVLTNIVSSGGQNSYTSPTNVLKVSYNTSGSQNYKNFWEASYYVDGMTTIPDLGEPSTNSPKITTYEPEPTTEMTCSVNEDVYGVGSRFVYPYTCGSVSFHSDSIGHSYAGRCVRFENYQGATQFDLYRTDAVYFARLQYIGRYGDITDINRLIFCPGIWNLVKLNYYIPNSITQIFYGVTPSYPNTLSPVADEAATTAAGPEGSDCYFEYYNNGTITSPGYPGNYSNNLNCTYKLKGVGSYVLLRFNAFNLESNYDRVTIYDGEVEDGIVLGFWLTGNGGDPNLVDGYYAFSGQLTLVFTTDVSVVRTGFSAYFQAFPFYS